MSGGHPRRLRCPVCYTAVADRWRCPCGEPLEFLDPPVPESPPPRPGSFDARDGLWAFEAFLPVGADPADRVTLGEGMTPVVDADGWDASFKLEYVFPTGSFKDRGATTTMTRATELGVDRVVEDSSGNAGAAIATYAARAGIDAEIYVPADVKETKLTAIRRAGATPVRVRGDREAVTAACVAALAGDAGDAGCAVDAGSVEDAVDAGSVEDAVDAGNDGSVVDETNDTAWYASHAWNPAFFEGTATFAYELAFQRDWTVPDAVVTPLGHGTLFVGAYWGFRRLHRAGWTDGIPRLIGAQAAGIAPIVRDRHGSAAADRDGDLNAAADGIRITEPVRSAGIHEAIAASGGDVVAVTEPELDAALDRLHASGFYTEPTSAVAPAALESLRERDVIGADDDVVVALTGSGLKT